MHMSEYEESQTVSLFLPLHVLLVMFVFLLLVLVLLKTSACSTATMACSTFSPAVNSIDAATSAFMTEQHQLRLILFPKVALAVYYAITREASKAFSSGRIPKQVYRLEDDNFHREQLAHLGGKNWLEANEQNDVLVKQISTFEKSRIGF